jgi:predicted nucleic acid-binding protein
MKADRYLVDTSVWVRYFNGEEGLEERLKTLILKDKVSTAGVVILEILRGARSAVEYNQLYLDFKALPLLEVDTAVWEEGYQMGFKLRRAGIVVPLADILIAAIAVRHRSPLLHRDRHFTLIAKNTVLAQEQI